MKKALIVLFVVGPLVVAAIAIFVASGSSVSSDTDREPLPGEAIVDEEALELVEVAADGTHFDPPVEGAQIPAGVWICDMNTVHYASQNEGDGRCPVCGMHLTIQQLTEAEEQAPESAD